MKTNDKLKRLFAYQKFENNPELAKVINDTLGSEVQELCDDALYAAAGGKKETEDNKKDNK